MIRPFVSEKVLVLERIQGRKVEGDHGLAAERAHELAREFFKAYVYQVTIHGIYHADPHRGNVLLTADCRLALVDFGLLGRLDDDTRRSLSLLLLAVAQNRADDVADLILGLSHTSLSSDEAGFLQDIRRKPPATTGGRSRRSRPVRRSRICSASRSNTASACRRASRSSGRPSPGGLDRTHPPSRLDPIGLLEEDAVEVMLREASSNSSRTSCSRGSTPSSSR